MAAEFEAARERLIEAVAEADEDLADKYLEGEELTDAEVVAGARKAVLAGDLVPILATSATRNLGIDEFVETVNEFLPSPLEGNRPAMKDNSGSEVDVEVDPGGPLAALVFKTTADPFVGKLSVFRVFRGTISSNSEVWNSARNQSERIGQLYLPRGKSQENIVEVSAGDIGAIGKLAATVTGDTLCVRDNAVSFEPIEFPQGSTVSRSVQPPRPTWTRCPPPSAAWWRKTPASASHARWRPARWCSPASGKPR